MTAKTRRSRRVPDHFVDVNKTIQMPKSAEKEIPDIMLTRYACYLIAQNGDPKKPWRRGHGGGDRVKALVRILFNCIGGDHSYVHELFHLLPVIILDRNLS
jgi:hypothetical protein